MKKILPANNLVLNIIGKQKLSNKPFRPLKHVLIYKVDEGKLIYNCLTGELILLENDEELNTSNIDLQNKLIEKWYLVPTDNDDNKLCDDTNNLAFLLSDNDKHPPITSYTIFTTTDCNARCFYCFEKGTAKLTMSAETANDVAEYIIKNCKGLQVKFKWFGGEPLYNSNAIDIICTRLKKAGIKYSSNMVTNGYLFNKDMISKSINIWNLKNVQIALDGTEEIYNRYKSYIYNDGSAFVRVMNNIESLLKSGINVKIRFNMDYHNYENLYLLADQLHKRFNQYKNLSFSLHLLFEKTIKVHTTEERHQLIEKYESLKNYLAKKINSPKSNLSKVRRWKQCMADNNAATTVLPDGRLGKCDYYTDEGIWGSIYSDEVNEKEIARFKKMVRPDGGEKCNNCPVRPICYKLEMCSDRVTRCDTFDQLANIRLMEKSILNAYIDFNNV